MPIKTQNKPNLSKPLRQIDLLTHLISNAIVNHLTVKLVKVSQDDGNKMIVNMILKGSFEHVLTFVVKLLKQDKIGILNFVYQLNQKEILMNINFIILKNVFSTSAAMIVLQKIQNPFCVTTPHASLQATSITMFKMLAYVQRGSTMHAVILLPNHSMLSVRKGSLLGREHALVTAITRDHIKVMLPNKKTWIIR